MLCSHRKDDTPLTFIASASGCNTFVGGYLHPSYQPPLSSHQYSPRALYPYHALPDYDHLPITADIANHVSYDFSPQCRNWSDLQSESMTSISHQASSSGPAHLSLGMSGTLFASSFLQILLESNLDTSPAPRTHEWYLRVPHPAHDPDQWGSNLPPFRSSSSTPPGTVDDVQDGLFHDTNSSSLQSETRQGDMHALRNMIHKSKVHENEDSPAHASSFDNVQTSDEGPAAQRPVRKRKTRVMASRSRERKRKRAKNERTEWFCDDSRCRKNGAPRYFGTKDELGRHLRFTKVHALPDASFPCGYCEVVLTRKDAWGKHQRRKHPGMVVTSDEKFDGSTEPSVLY
ncbi:hypothetical protein EW146_g8006 [Bondarzewia mesenterica]|uniref:C2H2-type domain-containing protein n=1 Tax=Bondarzewia mesenterica TaxID=1095465 RepID=A0A4S4LHQ9_9AGAM|nr:hypothetical protein EW146_g8006 [Bondarzewia mesenterica]